MPVSQIHINDPAAEADKAKIRRAIEKLNDSLQSIRSLKSAASGMQGLTASAIVNKCSSLENRIYSLIQQLEGTIAAISKVTEDYHSLDNSIIR